MKKYIYYYIGTKSEMKIDLEERPYEFMSKREMLQAYRSLKEMKSMHGARYVQKIYLSRRLNRR